MHPEKQKKIIILAAILVGIITLPGGCNTLLGGNLFSGGFLGLQQQDPAPAEPAYQSPLWEEDGLDARQAEYAGFLETVADGRLTIYDGTIPVLEENWMDENTGFNEEYTDEQLEALATAPETPPETVSAEEAKEDVDTAFALLRGGYAAYDYFGGRKAFNDAREEALARLPETGEVEVEALRDIILSAFREVATDNILSVGGLTAVEEQQEGYYVPGLYFSDPADAVTAGPAEAVPTITPDGALGYTLCAAVTEAEAGSLPETAEIEGETVALDWQPMDGDPLPPNPITESALPDGTVVLSSSGFTAEDEEGWVRLDALSQAGASFSLEPVLIWDLRSNHGGRDSYFSDWFGGFTGRSPLVKMSYAARITPLNQKLLNFVLAPWWYVDGRQGQLTPRNGFTFAVQDVHTAGPGESVLCQLRSIENLLTVGAPTAGAMLTGNPVSAYLPHSGLQIVWGTKIQQLENGWVNDGEGIPPDLWVPAEEALARIEAMIEYYGLRDWGAALINPDTE